MSLFSSQREKKLWYWIAAVVLTIYSTLFLGQPFAKLFTSQDLQAIVFVVVMILVGIAVLLHAMKTRPSKKELVILISISAVYIMFFLRLGMPERSHLLEYSALAILVHMALLERIEHGHRVPIPSLLAMIIPICVGILDECLQLFIPDRVFDIQDIIFNSLAVLFAICTKLIFMALRKK